MRRSKTMRTVIKIRNPAKTASAIKAIKPAKAEKSYLFKMGPRRNYND
jgi:hypothetical protein